MARYEVKANSAAVPAAVYSVLLDGSTWPAWMGVDSVEVEPANPERERASGTDRVGEVRTVRTGRYSNREQIVELVPGRRFAYIILDGMLHNYKGEVDLELSPTGGTEIRWRGVFGMRLPGAGWLMQLYLTRWMQRAVNKLARYAEQV